MHRCSFQRQCQRVWFRRTTDGPLGARVTVRAGACQGFACWCACNWLTVRFHATAGNLPPVRTSIGGSPVISISRQSCRVGCDGTCTYRTREHRATTSLKRGTISQSGGQSVSDCPPILICVSASPRALPIHPHPFAISSPSSVFVGRTAKADTSDASLFLLPSTNSHIIISAQHSRTKSISIAGWPHPMSATRSSRRRSFPSPCPRTGLAQKMSGSVRARPPHR